MKWDGIDMPRRIVRPREDDERCYIAKDKKHRFRLVVQKYCSVCSYVDERVNVHWTEDCDKQFPMGLKKKK